MSRAAAPIGTRVSRETPDGRQLGWTLSEIDSLTGRVMVQWDEEGRDIRTEFKHELTFHSVHKADPDDPDRFDDPEPATSQTATSPAQELAEWWEQLAHDEIRPLLAKMEEYGGLGRAIDLEEIGRGLVHSGVRGPKDQPDREPNTAELQELGIYFYLLGKFARWTAAVAEGRLVSDDTLHDIGVYVRMAQRVRAVGGWPT